METLNRGSRIAATLVAIGVIATGALVLSGAVAYAAGDANMQACSASTESSPGFRAYLPDCRAYELVTPPARAGVSVDRALYLAAPDGSRTIGGSFEAPYGAEGTFTTGEFDGIRYPNPYELTRTSSGWLATSLSPPVADFNIGFMVAASSDLALSLWELPAAPHPNEGGSEATKRDLYLREANGHFTLVGPYTPAPATSETSGPLNEDLVGASASLERVATVTVTERWPGDATTPGPVSLYEYTGTGNSEPRLVGVRNEGILNGAGHVNEDARQISRCGTELGTTSSPFIPFGHLENAVSPNGKAIFFTAAACEMEAGEPEVNELYARLANPGSPAGAQTVAISEPSRADCGACVESAKADAEFQGASEDGSKAFFTTEQELLGGQSTNNLYEYSFDAPAGEKIKLVSAGSPTPEVVGVTAISEDGSHVYFVARGVLASEPDRSLAGGQQTPVQGQNNLYVYDEGRVSFIATLNSEAEAEAIAGDCLSAEITFHLEEECEHGAHATEVWHDEPVAQTTPDGQYLVFASLAHLTAGDTSAVPQLFEYDAATGTVARVSVGQAGFNANGNDATPATMPHLRELDEGSIDLTAYFERDTAATAGLSVSEGGDVFFQGALALTPLATEGDNNVYEYVPGAGEVFLISDGHDGTLVEGAAASYLGGVSRSGEDVFFSTASSLVPEDANGGLDLYDARLDGGFPAAASTPACSGEGCLGAASPAPQLGGASSAAQPPGGNLPPPTGKTKAKTHKRASTHRRLTRAQKLRRALRGCDKRKRARGRESCKRSARARYGAQKTGGRDKAKGAPRS